MMKRFGRTREYGMTLVELMVALAIVAMVSTAVLAMVRAGSSVNSALSTSISREWEVESALHRVVQQLRLCSSFSVPGGTSGGTSFSLVTQPDTSNSNQTYSVSYAFVSDASGSQLRETDSRYGTSALVNDVKSFDVRTMSTTSPMTIQLSMTVGSNPPITRVIKVTPRNQ